MSSNLSRPWISIDAATADEIAEVVMTCQPARCISSGSRVARKSHDRKKQLSTCGSMGHFISSVECELWDQAATLCEKVRVWHCADVVIRRISRFVMAPIVGSDSTRRKCLAVRAKFPRNGQKNAKPWLRLPHPISSERVKMSLSELKS
jgi:hypothetical protein